MRVGVCAQFEGSRDRGLLRGGQGTRGRPQVRWVDPTLHALVHRVSDNWKGQRDVAVESRLPRIGGYLPPADGFLEGAARESSPLRAVCGYLDSVIVWCLLLSSPHE